MKKIAIWSMSVLLLLTLTGCGKCEHEFDNGLITKEPTCTEEGEKTFTCSLCEETNIESVTKKPHTYAEEVTKEPTFDEEGEKTFTCENCGDSYTEAILVLDKESFNQNIYDQMIKFYHEGDYISALIVGRDAKDTRDPQTKFNAMFGIDSENTVNSIDDAKSKIDKLTKEILDVYDEYTNEQIQSAIENGDYEILDTLYYYKRLNDKFDSHIEFSVEQEWAYLFVNELQGEYRYFESEDSNIQLKINKFNLQIGDTEYSLHFKFIPEWDAVYKEPRFFFENGSIEKIRAGLIAITYEDGTCVKYQSDVGKEWEEEQKQREEYRKQQEEKAEQEYLANEPKIGMTADEVKASNWGSPQKINKTTYEWGTTEQWCYPNNEYIYFEDGIVTAIQESD